MQGTFKGWLPGKLYGFIKPVDGSEEVFIHKTTVSAPDQIMALSLIDFDVLETPRGLQAKNIEVISSPDEVYHQEHAPIATAIEGVVTFWLDAGYGFVRSDRFDSVFVHYSGLSLAQDGYLSEGDLVRFDAFQGKKGIEAKNVEAIGWEPCDGPLKCFADLGNPRWLFRLSELAEKEDWFYRHTKSPSQFPILSNYIHYTFHRLKEQNDGLRFTSDGKHAAFNTGLVTPNQEEIYGLFIKNPVSDRQPWKLRSFSKASDRDFLNFFGGNPPPLAEYFEDPQDLLFDRRCPLVVSIDHVLEKIERFPENLRDNPYLARQLLVSAEVQTKKRVYRNYKTAIPQYFRDSGGAGKLQLLLPVCLQNPAHADLALTVEKTEARDTYRGSTVLTLDMAYNNARLLARPDTEWLQP
jgi:cold shock CspA family protein